MFTNSNDVSKTSPILLGLQSEGCGLQSPTVELSLGGLQCVSVGSGLQVVSPKRSILKHLLKIEA